MPSISADHLLEQLNWRYATKIFDPSRKIPSETITALEDALVLAPSSFGLQPWKFIVVGDQAIKDQMPAISWNQTQPKDCSHMVVLAMQQGFNRGDVGRFIDRMAEARDVSAESLAGYEEFAGGFVDGANKEGWIDAWSKNQVYIAIGQLMAAAAMLGVDACPMEGIQPASYDKLLGLEGTGYTSVLGCALGYRSEDDKYASLAKVRYEKSEVLERR